MHGAILIPLSIAVISVSGCYKASYPPPAGTCENRDANEMLSADREWKVVRFRRWCAGSDHAYHLSVLRSAEPLPNEPGNMFQEDPSYDRTKHDRRPPSTIQLMWKADRELWVMHNPEMKLAYSESQIGDVTIVHTTEDLFEPGER